MLVISFLFGLEVATLMFFMLAIQEPSLGILTHENVNGPYVLGGISNILEKTVLATGIKMIS